MKLYHGSKVIIEKPTAGGSKPTNDYGASFYMTKDLKSAHEWACRNNSAGFVNEYRFDMASLKVLDLTDSKKWSVLHWLAILLHFRALDSGFVRSFQARLDFLEKKYYLDNSQYDVVIGYRADDAYFRFPLDFVRGNLTIEQLERSFLLGDLGIQYALMSGKAVGRLEFVRAIPSSYRYVGAYFENVAKATAAFDSLDKDEEGTRILDLMRGGR